MLWNTLLMTYQMILPSTSTPSLRQEAVRVQFGQMGRLYIRPALVRLPAQQDRCLPIWN